MIHCIVKHMGLHVRSLGRESSYQIVRAEFLRADFKACRPFVVSAPPAQARCTLRITLTRTHTTVHNCALCKSCGKTRCYAASFGQPEVRSLLFKSSLFFPRLSQSRATPPSEIRKLPLTVRRIFLSEISPCRNFSLRQHAFGTQQTAESQQPCTRFE